MILVGPYLNSRISKNILGLICGIAYSAFMYYRNRNRAENDIEKLYFVERIFYRAPSWVDILLIGFCLLSLFLAFFELLV